ADNVLPYDGPRIVGAQLLVDNALRVDDNGRPLAAVADAADNIDGDLPGQALLLQLFIEGFLHFAAAQRAAGDAAANENAMLRFRPDPLLHELLQQGAHIFVNSSRSA